MKSYYFHGIFSRDLNVRCKKYYFILFLLSDRLGSYVLLFFIKGMCKTVKNIYLNNQIMEKNKIKIIFYILYLDPIRIL